MQIAFAVQSRQNAFGLILCAKKECKTSASIEALVTVVTETTDSQMIGAFSFVPNIGVRIRLLKIIAPGITGAWRREDAALIAASANSNRPKGKPVIRRVKGSLITRLVLRKVRAKTL